MNYKFSILFSLALSFALMVSGQDKLATKGDEVAFDGYDLVSYFDGQVAKGKAAFSYQYMGVNLSFLNSGNVDRFKANPEKYFPAYGGWCAIAMVKGTFIVPDYSFYKIQDDRLLFFQVKAFFNGLTSCNRDPNKHIILADNYYRKYFPE